MTVETYLKAQARLSARGYVILADDGEYSADAADYWGAPADAPMGALVRKRHPWRTVTGQIVYAPRLVTLSATVGDLRRLAAAAGVR